MQQFLKQIAEVFYQNERERISNYAFVFPNKRAGLFFRKYLKEVVEQPLFAPHILSINEFFVQYTNLKVEARIPLLFNLYNVFKQQLDYVDSFELFMPFGEMLLSDFDEIEKYNIDAKQLFLNIKDLNEINDKFGGLTQDQIAIISRFWEKLLPIDEQKIFNKKFVEMWQYIYPIYCSYISLLKSNGVGYEGFVFADALQQLQNNDISIDYEKVVFIGFNALNKQESRLFDIFKQKNIADFYWDSQSSFFNGMTNAENFIKENEEKYPSHYSLQPKERQKEVFDIIAVPSSIGQTKQVYDILEGIEQKNENTVVVLPDERLLLPMLNSIPESVERLNVTMGYPLSLSAVHALVHSLFEMQMAVRMRKDNVCTFYYKHVLSILNNTSLQSCSKEASILVAKINSGRCFWIEDEFFVEDEFLKKIFIKSTEKDFVGYLIEILKYLYVGQSEIEKEILASYIMLLNQLNISIEKSGLSLTFEAIASLVDRAVGFSSVPFNGEPLEGVQLMGFLETRSLDFENVIITSLNEGVCPKKQNSASIIPYNLRKAFGLPTFEQQDAIAAYHFYRLLTGAKRVFLLYDDRIDDIKKGGEVSRYIYQLKYLFDVEKLHLKEKSLVFDVNFVNATESAFEIKKDEAIMQKIECYADVNSKKSLSASALNDYIQCPLKFYLSKIAGIKESDEITENIEANVFGSIFHKAMELIYKEYEGKVIEKDIFARLEASVDNAVKVAFSKEYLKITDESKYEEPKGRNELVTHVIKKYVQKTLDYDKTLVPFTYIKSEQKINCRFPISKEKHISLSGFIDRIHQKDGVFFVVDYKTGSDDLAYKDIEQLFDKEDVKRPKAVFQTLMYALMLKYNSKHYEKTTMRPNVFQIKKIMSAEYSPQIYRKDGRGNVEELLDYNSIAGEYEDKFRILLEEIFDPTIPFKQCSSAKKCEYCSFKNICGR